MAEVRFRAPANVGFSWSDRAKEGHVARQRHLAGESLPGQNDRAAWPQLASRFAPEFATGTRDEWVAAFAGLDARVSGPAGDCDTADALRR